MRKSGFSIGKQQIAIVAVTVIALLFLAISCIPATMTPNPTATPAANLVSIFPYIQSISAQVMPAGATVTPGVSLTPGASVSPSPTSTVTSTVTASPSATSTVTPSATLTATPSTSATPGVVVSPTASPAATATPSTGGPSVMISVQIANFTLVPAPTTTGNVSPLATTTATAASSAATASPTTGQGHLHFFMDVVPPITSGAQATTAPGSFVSVSTNTYTWPNVTPGIHIFSVELVNNDSTPLAVPMVASVLVLVPSTASATAPAITMMMTQIFTPGTTVTPIASATPSLTTSPSASLTPGATSTAIPGATTTLTPGATTTPSATASPLATASPSPTTSPTPTGVNIGVSIQTANFSIVNQLSGPAVAGQGHVHFFLDAVPPTFQGMLSVTGPGTYTALPATAFTWTNVKPGAHILSVELTNNDHTALNPPVVWSSVIIVPPANVPVVSPAISRAPSVTVSPSATVSPLVSPSPTASPAVSPSAVPTSTAGGPTTINLMAQNIAFNMSSITVRAGAPVTVNFNNMDNGIPHNFAVYTNSSATQAIFTGQIVTGPGTAVYSFTAPSTPGTYFFRCDIHPTTMTGQFIVQ